MAIKVKPDKVINIRRCVCKELIVRVYPWASMKITNADKFVCKRCVAKGVVKTKETPVKYEKH